MAVCTRRDSRRTEHQSTPGPRRRKCETLCVARFSALPCSGAGALRMQSLDAGLQIGVFKPVQVSQCVGQIEMGLGESRVDPQRLGAMGHGLVHSTLHDQGGSQVVVGFDIMRLEQDCFLVTADCLVGPVLPDQKGPSAS